MPAPVSVIIPTLNAAGELPATAEALMPGLMTGLLGEVVVSDGGSQDETLRIARALGATTVTGAAGRGGQIARGVAAARGPWVLVLHADTHLGPGWVEAARHHIADHPDRAGYFRLAFRAQGWRPGLVARGANLRSRWLGLPYGDQGLLLQKPVLECAGGVPDIPLMEDVVLARRLTGRLRPLDAEARTSARRYEAEGWGRRVARNLWTLTRFALGASPERLGQGYEARRITR